MMTELWALEATVRGQNPEARAVARQTVSAPIVAALFALWEQTLPRISGKSKLAEALRYAMTRRAGFQHRRTCHQASDHYTQEQPVRRI
jgi:transposase